MATNLVLIFIDVSCTKTLTDELILVKNITKGRLCFWIWLWFWFGVDAFVCDKEEEDCYEHPHAGNWSGKRPEGPGVLDCIKG